MTVSRGIYVVSTVLAALTILLVFCATGGTVFATAAPKTALIVSPYNSIAKISLAESLVTTQDPKMMLQAELLARGALRRQPQSAVAAMVMGTVAAYHSQSDRALRFFDFSERLSRRVLLTQLWLIEHSVAENDISATLAHYNRALSTVPAIGKVLLPVLVSASAEPKVTSRLAVMLRSRPLWWRSFLEQLVTTGTSLEAIGQLVNSLHLDMKVDYQRDLFSAALNRMVQLGGYRAAYVLYAQKTGSGNELIRDSHFDNTTRIAPFDWMLSSQSDLTASIESANDGTNHQVIMIATGNGASGTAASQLLLLPPGRFQVSAFGRNFPTGQPFAALTLRCAPTNATIVDLPFLTRGDNAVARSAIDVPAGCGAQLLELTIQAPLDEFGTGRLPEVTRIVVTRG